MIATILLQATGGTGTQTIIMFGLIAVVFLFFYDQAAGKKSKRTRKNMLPS